MSSLDQRNVKWKINQNLAQLVKELQKAYPSGSPVNSESVVAQYLCNIIEAAFIHGLKPSYFEKDPGRSKKSLPKPQFWNIICKISHTETIKRVDELKFITTRIGKCRAWLRLTLNDSAMTSYLSMILSREHKSLRTQHYSSYGLFLDGEYSDIFLRHLNGIEALPFDLSCNSSILNDWTKTPLELAGLVPPSSSDPLYKVLKLKTNNNRTPSTGRSIFKHRGSAPALLGVDIASRSLPSITAEEWSKKYGKENSPRTSETIPEETETDGNVKEEESVLHERKLRRRKKSISSTKGSWSSLSSSSTPASRSPVTTPRTGSFCETPMVIELQKRVSEMSSKRKNSITAVSADASDKTPSPASPNRGPSPSSSQDSVPHFDAFPPRDPGSSSTPQHESSSPDLISSSGSIQQNFSSSPIESSDKNKSDQNPIPNDSADAIDIYSSSYAHESKSENLDDSIGNSLSRIGGWSAPDVPKEKGVESSRSSKDSERASAISRNDKSSLEEVHEPIKWSTPDKLSEKMTEKRVFNVDKMPEIFIRREGYLRKMGDKFHKWTSRWFVLRGKTLSYYTGKDSDEVLGCVDLADVVSVTQYDLDNDPSFSVSLNDGTKHHMASSSKSAIQGWAADIKMMIKGPETVEVEPHEDIYSPNYIEEYEIITVASPEPKGGNTSWFSSMVAHIGRLPNERGLDTQSYQCADCASPIGIIHGAPRVCGYTGQYYCWQCHVNDETQIPSRIVRNWDFRKYKVAKRSKSFLEQVFSEPLIDMHELNPGIYKYIDEMGKVLRTRQQLVHLRSYMQTCRKFDMESVAKKLGSRPHFLENSHLYSVQDLCAVYDRSLAGEIGKIVTQGIKHAYGCSLCAAKGFYCEICGSDKVIFPFETDATVQCFECKGLFHRDCKNEGCPRCERRQRRLLAEMENQALGSESD